MPILPRFSKASAQEEAPAAVETFVGDPPPPPPPVADRLDWRIALLLSAVASAIYIASSSLWAFPGASADLTCMVVGAVPQPFPVDQAYVWFLRLFVPFGGARAATVASILVSGAAVGAMFLFVKATLQALMDRQYLSDAVDNGAFHAEFAPRLGGFVAAAALATCPPFWMAATRITPFVFALFPLLASAWLLVRFAYEQRPGSAILSAAVLGALCTQSTSAIQFLPALVVLWLLGAFTSEKPKWATLAAPAAAFFASLFLTAWICIKAFEGGAGYELMGYKGPIWVVLRFVQPLLSGSVAAIAKPHWLIFGGMTVLPFFAWILAGRFSLAGPDDSPAVIAMNVAVFVSSLMVLFGSRYSPWGILGFQAEQVTVYALAASSLSYCVVVAWLQLLFRFSSRPVGGEETGSGESGAVPASAAAGAIRVADEDSDGSASTIGPYAPGLGRFLRAVVLSATAIVLFRIAAFGHEEADSSASSFLRTYVDGVLDGLGGRDIVVTDSLFASMYRLRARERGMPLEILNLSEGASAPTRKLFSRTLEDPALVNALDLGSFPFLQEAIGRSPSMARRFALTWFPDLWNLGPYRMFPRSLLFLGASDAAPRSNPLGERSADPLGDARDEYLTFLDRIRPELDKADTSKNRGTVALSETVRRRLSFFGNDLAWYLNGAGRPADALALWRDVHTFDPENISAMLNFFNALDRDGSHPDECAAVRAELDEFAAQLRRPLQIWELSRSQGYVADPRAFAKLGWSWAMTGQTALAIGTLGSTIRDTEDARRAPLLRMLAAIHAKRGDFGRSEESWSEALARNPDDVQSILGLVSARLREGSDDGVTELLDRLHELGVPPEKIFPYRMHAMLVSGHAEDASIEAELRQRENPNDPDSTFALFTALVHVHASAAEERRPEIRRRLDDLAQRLRENAAARTRQGAVATASLHLIDRNWRGARDEFVLADKSAPGDLSILEQLLRLDYAIGDTSSAGRHARELVTLDPDSGFGNYVLGSLALQAGNTPSAEAFLRRSCETWESPLPRGDLAYAKYLLGDTAEALRLSDEAIAMRDNIHNVWDTRGLALLAMNRNDEAVESFEKAIAINSGDPVIHLHLARARFAIGDRRAALEILDAAERLDTRFRNEDLAFFNDLRATLRGTR